MRSVTSPTAQMLSAVVFDHSSTAMAPTLSSCTPTFSSPMPLVLGARPVAYITKSVSTEVSDSSWAAYLKGDRGVFTRRAVRLLDAGEAREILRHYDEDSAFREQVNRYIHDFEAMLRAILAQRDGSPLGVTLLSSDMGKLYVALAQAIERLRT